MATTTVTRLEIVSEFADGQTYQFSLNNPRNTQDDHIDVTDIEELNTWMLANQPLKIYNSSDDELKGFTQISSATVVTTQKNMFYEAAEGLWERDQEANAWKDNYN